MVHEINFDHDIEYKDSGSGANKKYGVKSKSFMIFLSQVRQKFWKVIIIWLAIIATIYGNILTFTIPENCAWFRLLLLCGGFGA